MTINSSSPSLNTGLEKHQPSLSYYSPIYFKGYTCFKKEWVGFEDIKPINIIIGKNNSGKSHLLDFVGFLCNGFPSTESIDYKFSILLEESILMNIFNKDTRGGELGGNFWHEHGKYFTGETAIFENINKEKEYKIYFENFDCCIHTNSERGEVRKNMIINYLAHNLIKNEGASINNILKDKIFKRLHADRDVVAEFYKKDPLLNGNGSGASNLIRKYLNSSDQISFKNIIKKYLLNAINEIFGGDRYFSEINIQEHEKYNNENTWEIYLSEKDKDPVALSKSGSGLKTVILVLLNLIVLPHFENKKPSEYVFAFEELENNLHPALLRNLLKYIEKYTREYGGVNVFLTTHSSVALDFFSTSNRVQFLHVSHDGESAKMTPIAAHFDKLNLINDLGAKPSDLLQANGIIWVEGPSDRIYVNRWIQIVTAGEYREGRHYQCAFYGGSLLAKLDVSSPEDEDQELVNLMNINPNLVVVCDSDKKRGKSPLKKRVERILKRVKRGTKAYISITNGKEVENYLSGEVLGKAFEKSNLPNPAKHETFFPAKSAKGRSRQSYLGKHLKRKSFDKIEIALRCVPHIDEKSLDQYGLRAEIGKIVDKIKEWNR